MFYNFCTLFDRNYLYKGLALYNSLKKHCRNFKLFILCMDNITYNLLMKMNLNNIELISLKEFEDPDLSRIKNTRTPGEYCWTCTASLILFLLRKYQDLEMMTYLDADLFFYNNPQPIFNEFGYNSIFIIEHNFSKEYQKLLMPLHGKYNVQFIIFKNDKYSLEALKWWRQKTIDWCYNKLQDGKFGDQLYLNDWPDRFKGVYVLQNKKLCLAPWNATKYHIFLKNNEIYVEDSKLIIYHFHSFEINNLNKFSLADRRYKIDKSFKDLVYSSYIREIRSVIRRVMEIDPLFKYGFTKRSINKKKIKGLIEGLIYSFFRIKA